MSTEDIADEAPEMAPKRGSVKYLLSDKGRITREDTKQPGSKPVVIAAIVETTAGKQVGFAHPDFVKYTNQVKGLLKAKGITAEILPYPDRPPVVRQATLVQDFSTEGDVREPAMPAVVDNPDGPDGMRSLTVEQRRAVNLLRSKEGFPIGELERPIPKAPAKTSGAGDKTPEYVTWLLRYQPAEFCRVYGVQRVGSIEVTIPGKIDPVLHVKKPATRRWEPGFVLAKRETIYTKVIRNQKPDEKEESL